MNGDFKINREEAGDELGQLRVRFEQWRQQKRHRRQRIPSALWDAATGLARQRGIYPVARTLRLDYILLKKRAGLACERQRSPATMPFVECLLPGPAIASENVVELVNRHGARMILRLPGSNRQDWQALAQLFWREAP
jgi:hypothetical protein